MTWEKAAVLAGAPVLDAIQILNSSSYYICFVTDSEKRLLGSVTDGDVRRGLLKGYSIKDSVDIFMNPNPIVGSTEQTRAALIKQMKDHGIRQIPIVNSTGKIAGIEVLQELVDTMIRPNSVLLMAGGTGRRLLPLTENCPKPLLKVGSKPVLEIILERFVESGFRNFYVSVNYRARMIEDYFGDGRNWGVNIHYLREDKSLGTAGALSMLPKNLEHPIIVMNGDLLTKVDFNQVLEFHNEQRAPATMCVREYELQVPYGVIDIKNNKIEAIDEKPLSRYFVNSGIYILNPDVVNSVPANTHVDMTTIFQNLIEQANSPAAFPLHEYWLDIGHIDDFRRAEGEFKEVFK
jgi:dTDP-glucose pyrophosphorylase